MRKLILPKYYVAGLNGPLIFLVGPIKGAPLWQDRAIEIIHSQNSQIYIASPSRRIREEYAKESLVGEDNKFPKQTLWERHYLEVAKETGAILSWLPKDVEHFCDHCYARDTRGELGEFRGIMRYNRKFPLIIGAEEGFDGLDVLKTNFNAVCPELQFCSNLEETCSKAVSLALSRAY